MDRDVCIADAEAELVKSQTDFIAEERRRLGWAPEKISKVMGEVRRELHPPYDNPNQCRFEGACGAPGVICPVHQVGWTCQMEIDGIGVPQPGYLLRLSTVREVEHHLDGLRELWEKACPKERADIAAAAERAEARKVELQQAAGKANPCGHASSAHVVPPNVLTQAVADEHLDRLRELWYASKPEYRGRIEAQACAINILRPLLPAGTAS